MSLTSPFNVTQSPNVHLIVKSKNISRESRFFRLHQISRKKTVTFDLYLKQKCTCRSSSVSMTPWSLAHLTQKTFITFVGFYHAVKSNNSHACIVLPDIYSGGCKPKLTSQATQLGSVHFDKCTGSKT